MLAGTLLARGLLDVENPAHKAALDAETGVPPPASGVKRGRADDGGGGERVKRERDGDAAEVPVVDLTHEPVDPLLEVRSVICHLSLLGWRQHGSMAADWGRWAHD